MLSKSETLTSDVSMCGEDIDILLHFCTSARIFQLARVHAPASEEGQEKITQHGIIFGALDY